jgi:hypothetical protein
MVIVIVAEQDERNFRKQIEWNRWLPDAARPRERDRARALGIDRIGEDVAERRLDQEGRVADEGDDRRGVIERCRRARDDRDVRGPRHTGLTQHARDLAKRLAVCARGIEERPPVEMVACS